MSTNSTKLARIFKVVHPKKMGEGHGAVVGRLIGTSEVRRFDPFLMLDHFSGRLPGGFPDHPHRGFETVSYLLQGTFLHEDSKGRKGELKPGDVQWMTAGKGIIHAEMPGSETEDSIGLQLWINLPRDKKLIDPFYQEIAAKEIPVVNNKAGVTAKVISGLEFGVEGAVKPTWPVHYVDFQLSPNTSFDKVIPANWNSFIYVLSGEAEVNGTKIKTSDAVFFEKDASPTLARFTTGSSAVQFVWIGGQPIGEPIAQYGPFVMNTEEEIQQAFSDYQNARNGFEESKTWRSGIRKLSHDFDD
jgi:hypothetical protein